MVDIITLLSSYYTGNKIGGLISGWLYGANSVHLRNAIEYISRGMDDYNSDIFEEAINELNYINNDGNDRLYIVVASYYLKAICYTFLCKFKLAYYYLDELEKVEYDFWTRKKDTINEIKQEGRDFRQVVIEIEEEYNNSIQNDGPIAPIEHNKIWKTIAIILIVLLIIGVVLGLIYIANNGF